MSAIELPVTTKRSARFKRFSWNQAHDGTFPPLAVSKRMPMAHTDSESNAKPNAIAQKKASKIFGKKRKGAYLGPSWDDEAGSLPTSADAGELDFDALLSQMVSYN
ncbi:hypothetical protein IWW36_003103 [Coemansia brasiliensis]|uniref:Uncharacterized protein n=1 Tax=Coemansia brasiliensis TaxID=2650707 RepID=A0A9W8IEN1_9FUNG|nr:hypothetical protein IWW36_003103 [Coemansia brasiliensis]